MDCDIDYVGSGSFYTAPSQTADSVKFLAYGDSRTYPLVHDSVSSRIISTYMEDQAYQSLVLHAGDLVTDGNLEEDWANELFDPYYANIQELLANIPINGCRGGHEGDGVLFNKYFPYPYSGAGFYWSFDYGPMHVAILDQAIDYAPGSPQYVWLQDDLTSSSKKWKILVFHEPGWSAGGVHENNTDVQEFLQPLAIDTGVDLIFAGHNHYYARAVVLGIQHITTGGGGAPLYEPDPESEFVAASAAAYHYCEVSIQGDELYFTARDDSGNELDSFYVNKLVPKVSTLGVSSINPESATGNGYITWLGNPFPSQHGLCWNTAGTPTLSDSCTEEGPVSVLGAFSSFLGGLVTDTTYYVRAYATNSNGTIYGDQVSFTAGAGPLPFPFSKINPVAGALDQLTNVTLSWESSTEAMDYEYCYDTTNDGLCAGTWLSVGADTSVVITGLSVFTTYYWQVRAVNAVGSMDANDGEWWFFTTLDVDNDGDGVTVGEGDCDDANPNIYPGNSEQCDNLDNDCNPATVDGTGEAWLNTTCDGADSDLCEEGTFSCTAGTRTCSDTTGDILEICNGGDDDCNPATADGSDEPWLNQITDCGVGECRSSGLFICSEGTKVDTCTPFQPQLESCDGLDNDCDGQIDNGVLNTYYHDFDTDTYGNPFAFQEACVAPVNYVSDNSDCDDTNMYINPGAKEICDGLDNNCDAQIDENRVCSNRPWNIFLPAIINGALRAKSFNGAE